ncbi:hypothetical protein M0R04_12710 [Candidatus Dojkabacteria bacterium]|jgi:hypothetical protein|nr:hypothetical protein [Candidatus Dojkabacteria bacterium]
MGTGIGKYCERCGHQLCWDDGFVLKEDGNDYDLCKECDCIVRFDKNRFTKQDYLRE